MDRREKSYLNLPPEAIGGWIRGKGHDTADQTILLENNSIVARDGDKSLGKEV